MSLKIGGIGQEAAQVRAAVPREIVARDAAREQQLGDDVVLEPAAPPPSSMLPPRQRQALPVSERSTPKTAGRVAMPRT